MPQKATTKKEARNTAPKKEVEVNPALASKGGVKVEQPAVETAPETQKNANKEKYYEAVGRRKESIARVRLYTKKSTDVVSEERAIITINGKDYREYFTNPSLWEIVELPLKKLKSVNRFKASVVVRGGGKSGQADAIKHGLARTLVEFDGNLRKKLKKAGYLTRDPRAKERRKYGLKKARKAPRWSKR